ncbi:MAG TPA: vitamin K epoxide reductase family protein [Thermomicrobiales bacterium]|nr:vitamin K epoxide reductase family protein [Thermomicrobiales bacterium]
MAASGAGRRRGRALVALAALGVALAGYLTWVHYSGALALCAGAGGCETVQASRYAVVAGIPVALLGLLMYLALLALAVWVVLTGAALAAYALFGLALTGTLYSAYLTYLEVAVIRAICPWCVTSAALVMALCVLAAWEVAAIGYADATADSPD